MYPTGTQLHNADGSMIYRTELDYDNDNRVTEISLGGSDKVKYTYDNLGRVSKRVVEGSATAGAVTSEYTFVSGGHGTGSTTPLISRISQPKISFEYTYDNRGNIISEKRGTLTTTYVYDSLGQLVRVNDPLEYATWVYEYDRGGNITSKKKYAYTTGTLGSVQQTIPYVYGDPTWKDKLTSYNGQAISYDVIGNPLSDGTWTYTWQAGRQLKKMSKSGMTVEFKYDHNGLRTQKKVTQNGVTTTTNYALHDKLVMHMTVGSNQLHFFYDTQSVPVKISFNGTMYTYLYNSHGDIVGLIDNSGNLVVEYKYDAWGKLLSITGTLASSLGKLNPFRYRSYMYDEESALYYITSRYFNPQLNRWISVDDVAFLGADGSLTSYNLYVYCNNSPTMGYDPDGTFDWGKLTKGSSWIVAGITAVAVGVSVLTCGVAAPVMMAIAAVTVATGAATTVNGASEIGEVLTGRNVVRNAVFRGNATAYNTYAHAMAAVAQVGTAVCGGWMAKMHLA